MKVSEIYEKYKIMPNLQEHMLRVAGVASIICNNFEKPIDKKSMLVALLLHDMGNMSKFNIDVFPEFVKPEGLDYWKKAQEDFIRNYGKNDYQATYNILDELKISKKVIDLIKSIEFAKANENSKHNNFNKKISLYSDLRIAPFGVTPLKERLDEVRERYIKNKGVTEDFFNSLAESMNIIEKQIFAHCKIKPEDITEEKVRPWIVELRSFQIQTN